MSKTLSIVLPAYDEVENIEQVVSSILQFAPTMGEQYEVIIVDDGSKDGTAGLIDRLAAAHNQVVAVHHPFNRGYGAALRSGFKTARGKLIFFMDGDGQFDIGEMPKLMRLIQDGVDIACGYRIKRADPLIRTVNAALYNAFVRVLFGLRVKDIDCAFKLFKRKVIDDITLSANGALINTEFLILAKQKGYHIKQVGVSHFPRTKGKQTGNNLVVVLRAFAELAKFWDKIKGKRVSERNNER